MKHSNAGDGERTLAVFVDFENLALGFGGRRDRFQIEKVLERLVEKGKIVAKKAYADWSRFGTYAGSLHEAAIELIEIPKRSMTGKNSADIRLVVDAIDLAYSKDHIDTFVIVSGDSDFSPLVSKLKELGKHVIGLGLVEATSNLLRDNCDEFIYYEDLDRHDALVLTGGAAQIPEVKRKVFNLLMDSLVALRRENKDVIFSSMVKDTMKRKKPSFNEEYHGYRTFSELLEDGQRHGLIEIEKHKTSGTYVVNRFGDELRRNAQPVVQQLPPPIPLALPAPRPLLQSPPLERAAPIQRNDRGPRPATPPPPPPIQRPVEPRQPLSPPARLQPILQPRSPLPKPPTPSRFDEEEDGRLPLGRSLIEEVDDSDDLDEIPSYAPKRNAPAEVSTKAPAAKREPARPRKAPAEKPPAKTAPKPRAAVAERPAPPPAERPKPVEKPKPTPKPAVEEDGFGSGLDD